MDHGLAHRLINRIQSLINYRFGNFHLIDLKFMLNDSFGHLDKLFLLVNTLIPSHLLHDVRHWPWNQLDHFLFHDPGLILVNWERLINVFDLNLIIRVVHVLVLIHGINPIDLVPLGGHDGLHGLLNFSKFAHDDWITLDYRFLLVWNLPIDLKFLWLSDVSERLLNLGSLDHVRVNILNILMNSDWLTHLLDKLRLRDLRNLVGLLNTL